MNLMHVIAATLFWTSVTGERLRGHSIKHANQIRPVTRTPGTGKIKESEISSVVTKHDTTGRKNDVRKLKSKGGKGGKEVKDDKKADVKHGGWGGWYDDYYYGDYGYYDYDYYDDWYDYGWYDDDWWDYYYGNYYYYDDWYY